MSYSLLKGDREVLKSDSFTLVVDAKALDPNKGADEIMLPRAQVEILQLLTKIQRAESWNMWVLFNGNELPQVPHGGEFMGLRVFFSPTPPQRIPTLLECVNVIEKRGGKAVMLTQDLALEDRCRARNVITLRGETFKKAYEDLFTIRHRPQSRLMRQRSVEMERDRYERDHQSAIRDMIDLVE